MKRGTSLTKKILTWIVSAFLLSFIAFSVGCDDDDDTMPVDNSPYTLSGNASALQMVPVPDSSLAGTGTLTGTYNPANGQLIYTTTWTGLTGAPIGGGIYIGLPGTVGTPLDTTWAFDSTYTATGSFTDTILINGNQPAQLIANSYYYMLKTEENPDGEIRGQVTATR